jgi:phosphatidylglycerophosphate synthase
LKTPKRTSPAARKPAPRKTRKGQAGAAAAVDPAQPSPPAPARADAVPDKPAELHARPALPGFEPALCLIGETSVGLWGRSLPQRTILQFAREGLTRLLDLDQAKAHNGPLILVRADAVLDQPLISVLLKRPQFVLLSSDDGLPVAAQVRAADLPRLLPVLAGEGAPPPGLLARTPADLDTHFWKALRKRETPYALRVSEANRRATEWRMFMGTYKGATDLVTKHVWPVPAFHATRFLAPRGVTPNMVTTVAAVLTALAFWLFWEGHFAPGLVAAWTMTFLDTVDGKLARTTLTSSKWGDVFDHGIDLVHPPFWYWAWGMGLAAWNINWSASAFWWVIGIILGGYVLQRVMEGIAIKWLGLEIHIWRPIDTFFRQITARRNPNLIILSLSLLVGRPDWGLIAVAAWTGLCLILHGLQLLQALAARKAAGGPLTSWMTRK